MNKICPTCSGVGSIPQPMPDGTVMGYVGPNGESWPMTQCKTCWGTGWIWETAGCACPCPHKPYPVYPFVQPLDVPSKGCKECIGKPIWVVGPYTCGYCGTRYEPLTFTSSV